MNGPTVGAHGDIAMWENKFYIMRQGANSGIDEFLADYTTNTYSFVQNIPGPPNTLIYSVSYDMRDAVTLVSHQQNSEKIFIWDISSGTAVLSSTIKIGVEAFGDLVNTSQGFMVAYNGAISTNPPSWQNGIAHYDFAGNLIDFVSGVSSAGMYKIHSTGEIFFDDSTQSGGGIAGGGLHQLFYDGVPMSIGPQIHSSPYPPISAVNWQGASSYCPTPPCDHQDMMNAAGATVFPIYLNAGALSNFTNFTTNMWNNYIGVVGNISGCDWWWNRWTHWTGQIATGTITNPTQLALKSEKINFVEEMLNNCGCYGVSSPQNIASNIDSYNCIGNNRCVLVGETEIGQFTSLSACQDNCGDGGWNCQALAGYQSCYQVDLPSIGTYATLLDCQAGFINGGLGPCKTMESWDDKDDAPPERFKRPTKRSHKNKKY